MSRAAVRTVAVVVAAGVLAVAVACSDAEAACTVDADCAPGSFCRAGFCAAVAVSDAGSPDVQVSPTCASPGASCSVDDDCCVRPCSGFRCGGGTGTSGRPPGSSGSSGASSSSGTTSSGGTCQDLFAPCASDFECCTGLTCTTSMCR